MAVDWSKFDHLLGNLPDGQIARMAGVSRISVVKRRKVWEIEAYVKPVAGRRFRELRRELEEMRRKRRKR